MDIVNTTSSGNFSDGDVLYTGQKDCCHYGWTVYISLIFLTTVFVTGLFGNLVVLRVMVAVKHKSSTDIFVTFLSASDLMAVLTNIPVHVIMDVKAWTLFGSNFGCKIHYFLLNMTFISSELFFTFIGLDRYLKIFHPHGRNPLQRWPLQSSCIIILFTFLLAARRFMLSGNDEQGSCSYSVERTDTLLSVISTGLLVLACLSICFSYWKIIWRMRKTVFPVPVSETTTGSTGGKPAINHRNTKMLSSSRVLVLISVLFLGCTVFPVALAHVLYRTPIIITKEGQTVALILSRMYYVNVCINPYIYFTLNSEFRKRVKCFLKQLCKFKWIFISVLRFSGLQVPPWVSRVCNSCQTLLYKRTARWDRLHR